MIRTDAEYKEAYARLRADMSAFDAQRQQLVDAGLSGEQLVRALQPLQAFNDQLSEELEVYERMRRGDFEPITDLNSIGRLLIGLRIWSGFNQRQLAEKLGVSESLVSRDERNEYHGITVERAQRIFDVLRARVHLEVEGLPIETSDLITT